MSGQIVTVEYNPIGPDEPEQPVEPSTQPAEPLLQRGPSRRRGVARLWVLGATGFLISLMVVFWRISAGTNYARFEPSLLTISVTFAVFAVNFSFVEYQLSPYRALFRGIAWMHVASALGVLLVSIVPVGAALLGWAPGRVAAALLPFIAVSSVLLALVARRCADPLRRIRIASSSKEVLKFSKRFSTASKIELDRNSQLKLSSVGDEPMHEWEYRLPPRTDFFDPFDAALALASAAISTGDGQVFDAVTDGVLTMQDTITTSKPLLLEDGTEADYRVRAVLLDHVQERVVQLARMALETDKIDRYARGFAENLAARLRTEAAFSRQTADFARMMTSTLSFLAVETYKRGWRTTPMRTLIIVRECATVGVRRSPEKKEEAFTFLHELVRFPLVVDTLAEAALEKRDSEFLYRCLDTLGWLGCAAVRADKKDVGLACVQSLVQLARKSRHQELECFWTRCGMLPWQHARERIEWMLTWVPKITNEISRKLWLESFSEAYSRIEGTEIEIELKYDGDKTNFTLKRSGKPHKITYIDTDTVTYDFSDESMLRELQLH